MRKGKQKKYSARCRRFAMTLAFYKKRAYNYVRETFDNALPACSTIRSWYNQLECRPGHMKEAYDHLKQLASENDIHVALVMDEMSIYQKIEWCAAEKRHYGYITFGENDESIATKAFVFLVSGINFQFKLPVSYFFVDNNLKGQDKAVLLNEVIEMLIECNIKVRCVTMDGDATNLRAVEILGASFSDYRPFFIHKKARNIKIYVTLDACHMLKLARNLLGKYLEIFNSDRTKIVKWEFISMLFNLQQLVGQNIGGVKLTRKHIEYTKRIMNVRLAAETLSRSVAVMLNHLSKENLDGFDFSAANPTAEYGFMIDVVFDILNSHCINADGFKAPIKPSNIHAVKEVAKIFREYVSGLFTTYKKKVVRIIDSRLKTSFLGFICTLNNAISLYEDMVVNERVMNAFVTIRISQDVLELLFGEVRQMGGNNRNPSAREFEAALKKLLFINEVKSSEHANCQDFGIRLLTVNANSKLNQPHSPPRTSQQFSQNACLPEQTSPQPTIPEQPSQQLRPRLIYPFNAANLESAVLKATNNKKYETTFQYCQKINDPLINSLLKFGGVDTHQPCVDTVAIVELVEQYTAKIITQSFEFDTIVNKVLSGIIINDIYINSPMDNLDKYELLKMLISRYLHTRFAQRSAANTLNAMPYVVGNKSAQLRNFLGQ